MLRYTVTMLPSEIDPYLFVLSVALFFERTAELPKKKNIILPTIHLPTVSVIFGSGRYIKG